MSSEFRLERVYRMRSRQHRHEELRTLKANQLRSQSRTALEAASDHLDRKGAALVESGTRGCNAATLHRRWWHMTRLQREKEDLEEDLQVKERHAEECRHQLRRARQRKDVLKSLKERAEARTRLKQKRREQKTIDDVASARYVMRRGERGP